MAYPSNFTLRNREEVLWVELNPRTASLSVTVMLNGERVGVGTLTKEQFSAVEDVINDWRGDVERVTKREEEQWLYGKE